MLGSELESELEELESELALEELESELELEESELDESGGVGVGGARKLWRRRGWVLNKNKMNGFLFF